MDIGAWGPIAGFIVTVPTLVVGLAMSQVREFPHEGPLVYFSEPILFKFLAQGRVLPRSHRHRRHHAPPHGLGGVVGSAGHGPQSPALLPARRRPHRLRALRRRPPAVGASAARPLRHHDRLLAGLGAVGGDPGSSSVPSTRRFSTNANPSIADGRSSAGLPSRSSSSVSPSRRSSSGERNQPLPRALSLLHNQFSEDRRRWSSRRRGRRRHKGPRSIVEPAPPPAWGRRGTARRWFRSPIFFKRLSLLLAHGNRRRVVGLVVDDRGVCDDRPAADDRDLCRPGIEVLDGRPAAKTADSPAATDRRRAPLRSSRARLRSRRRG